MRVAAAVLAAVLEPVAELARRAFRAVPGVGPDATLHARGVRVVQRVPVSRCAATQWLALAKRVQDEFAAYVFRPELALGQSPD